MGNSGEAGEFFARFFLTLLNETINKVFGRDIKDEHDVVASIRDWKGLIDQLNHFKDIHKFTQQYLNNVEGFLFGGSRKTKITIMTSARVVKERWEDHYKYEFKDQIDKFKERLRVYRQRAEQQHGVEPPELVDGVTGHVNECTIDLKVSVPKACEAADDFVETIEKVAELALGILEKPAGEVDSIIQDIINYKRDLNLKARRLLCLTDEVLVKLIDVLDALYTKAIP